MRISPRFALAGVALAAGGLLTACTSSGTGGMPGMSHSSPSTQVSSHNAQDVVFAQMMIVHHRGAVEMADLAPSRAESQNVKDLAAKIKAAQQPEITSMQGWLKAWGEPAAMTSMGPNPTDSGHDMSGMGASSPGPGMDSMPGMSPTDMEELKAATGTAFDKKFLSLMIEHHQGAVDMAKQEQIGGMDRAAKKLANSIVSSQTAEISEMKAMLAAIG